MQLLKKEGHSSWSLLQAKSSDHLPKHYCDLLSYFNNGDLILIGARPSMGKTSFSIGLFVQAIQKKKAINAS